MEPLSTGILLVDNKFRPLTCCFAIKTPVNAYIVDLKEKAQEMWPDELSSIQLNLPELSVWKMKGDIKDSSLTLRELSEILGKIDIDSNDTIQEVLEEVADDDKVADLGLSDGETLLLQLPPAITDDSSVGDPITTDVDPEYKLCFLKVHLKGEFRESDVRVNNIFDADSDGAPKFVTDHEGILSQKRMLAPEMRVLAEGMIDEGILAEYFCSTEEFSESSPIVNLPELQHLVHLSSVDAQWWRSLNSEKARFKEADAYWLLFSAVTKYYVAISSTGDDNKPITTIDQSLESWPFHLLIKAAGNYHTYKPTAISSF